MLGTLGIVETRCSRSPDESKLARRLAGKPLIEWVVRRATDCQRLDGVIAVVDNSPAGHQLAALVPPDVPVFFGDSNDPLRRFVAALEKYQSRAVVRFSADSPFIDPVLTDQLVTAAAADRRRDYVGYRRSDGQPTGRSSLGVFAEWFSALAIRHADREATGSEDREDVACYILSHADRFSVRWIPVPVELDREDLRLTIDGEEDLEHARVIFEAIGRQEWDWRTLAGLLNHQPLLRGRMAALNRDCRPVTSATGRFS